VYDVLENVGFKSGAAKCVASNNDKLVYVGPRRDFPECLVGAVQTAFDDIEVLRLSKVEELFAANAPDADQVRLVLIHDWLTQDCLDNHDALLACFPNLDVATVCNGQPKNKLALSHLMQCDNVRGILPFNLPLDVWLCALRLLLSGGEYIAKDFVNVVQLSQARPAEPTSRERHPPKAGSNTELTCRQVDVIELVAEGLQNKQIAARLNLSEYTIKIHIHHIIHKLGVHNRTQAAAVYLSEMTTRHAATKH
jgi:DNA-binding NarL/FixJ family response regulator